MPGNVFSALISALVSTLSRIIKEDPRNLFIMFSHLNAVENKKSISFLKESVATKKDVGIRQHVSYSCRVKKTQINRCTGKKKTFVFLCACFQVLDLVPFLGRA